jgi:hypothetical protein
MPSRSRKEHQHALRMDEQFKQAVDKMAKNHGAESLSDYFRGLVVLDSLLSSGIFVGEAPSWFWRRYPEAFVIRAHDVLAQQRRSPEPVAGVGIDLSELKERLKRRLSLPKRHDVVAENPPKRKNQARNG